MVHDFLGKAVREFLEQGFNTDSSFSHFIRFMHTYHPKITLPTYEKYLYTCGLPPMDLIIRTGDRKRISNFLPWQGAYAEVHFTDLLWPDFRKKDLEESLIFFAAQHRTFGVVKS
jgi:undecaprenyl diphosphate synthase